MPELFRPCFQQWVNGLVIKKSMACWPMLNTPPRMSHGPRELVNRFDFLETKTWRGLLLFEGLEITPILLTGCISQVQPVAGQRSVATSVLGMFLRYVEATSRTRNSTASTRCNGAVFKTLKIGDYDNPRTGNPELNIYQPTVGFNGMREGCKVATALKYLMLPWRDPWTVETPGESTPIGV